MPMLAGELAFAVLAVNPIGGLLVAIPFAIFELHWPAWLATLAGLPLSYVQVAVVDIFWSQLARIDWWRRFLERRRSPRVERLVATRGFWMTTFLTPFIGPWLVMAFMRYAQVPQRKVALPICLGIAWSAGGLAGLCVVLPRLFQH
jgi:hypothetical protein